MLHSGASAKSTQQCREFSFYGICALPAGPSLCPPPDHRPARRRTIALPAAGPSLCPPDHRSARRTIALPAAGPSPCPPDQRSARRRGCSPRTCGLVYPLPVGMTRFAAFRSQLTSIMEALSRAAVAEICELLDDSCAVLQLEIRRSHAENQALRRKLELMQDLVARGHRDGGPGEDCGASSGAPQPKSNRRRNGSGRVGVDSAACRRR
ncbi:hypothetical protein D4764_15G0004880 [Takifugu flavidus]|uniref:Uncharacterized protein n=1 Tax=Takifugu flavidus TaxID=433684 RepID=A0A5C6P025_9TELE|nr:hypothetical protein D4764_15G0004880 [Takifugu flavidus]